MLQNQANFFISYLWVWNSHFKPLLLFLLTVCAPPRLQAIQDITRNRDIDPEEIVSLIFERIDNKGEGKKKKDKLKYSSIHVIIKGSSWDSVKHLKVF